MNKALLIEDVEKPSELVHRLHGLGIIRPLMYGCGKCEYRDIQYGITLAKRMVRIKFCVTWYGKIWAIPYHTIRSARVIPY
ncbi:210_t:CDS:2 [Entrophospora sp. SA101]|nr:210_t:CDS:2 [Entrophospora sp. SA101]